MTKSHDEANEAAIIDESYEDCNRQGKDSEKCFTAFIFDTKTDISNLFFKTSTRNPVFQLKSFLICSKLENQTQTGQSIN